MNRVIWKYAVHPDDSILLPQGTQILSVACQQGKPHFWALVDPEAAIEPRHFRTIATGEPFDPTGLVYRGTFHGVEGWMVFHLYERMEVAA